MSRNIAVFDTRISDRWRKAFGEAAGHMTPDLALHPIYDALYRWGAVIAGPRGFELAEDRARRGRVEL